MEKTTTLEQILNDGFTLEVSRFPDAPLEPSDQVLYRDPYTGRVIIARAPLVLLPGTDPRYHI